MTRPTINWSKSLRIQHAHFLSQVSLVRLKNKHILYTELQSITEGEFFITSKQFVTIQIWDKVWWYWGIDGNLGTRSEHHWEPSGTLSAQDGNVVGASKILNISIPTPLTTKKIISVQVKEGLNIQNTCALCIPHFIMERLI